MTVYINTAMITTLIMIPKPKAVFNVNKVILCNIRKNLKVCCQVKVEKARDYS